MENQVLIKLCSISRDPSLGLAPNPLPLISTRGPDRRILEALQPLPEPQQSTAPALWPEELS